MKKDLSRVVRQIPLFEEVMLSGKEKNGVFSFIWTTTRTIVPLRNVCSVLSIRTGPVFSGSKGNCVMRAPKN